MIILRKQKNYADAAGGAGNFLNTKIGNMSTGGKAALIGGGIALTALAAKAGRSAGQAIKKKINDKKAASSQSAPAQPIQSQQAG